MPQVAPSHLTANRAIALVCGILSQAGALAETIKNDYGEDLLVQTHLKNVADNFHVLIQVKARSLKKRKDGNYSVSFDLDHIRRWTSHIQPVLVCVADLRSSIILAFNPRERFSLWQLATSRRKSLSVILSPENKFSKANALKYIWACRIEYYSRMLSWYDSHLFYAVEGYTNKKAILSERNIVVFSFLLSIGVIDERDRFDKAFVRSVKNASENFARENAESDEEPLGISHVFHLCLLGQVAKIHREIGLPSNILTRGAEMAEFIFKHYLPKEWSQINQLFKQDARPSRAKRVGRASLSKANATN